MKQSQETCQFFNNPFMTCDVRRYYQFGVVSRMIFATLCFSSCIRKSSWSTGEMAQTICFRIWSAFYVVPTFYIVQERNGANEEDYFGEEYFINAVSHQ